MSGTKAGGMKTKETNLRIHGKDFYQRIGRKGGSKLGVKKGFALMSREQIQECGRKGGRISKRGKAKSGKSD